jgi:hypothetical protein
VISRYLVIVLALGAAGLQASRGAWIEAIGLLGLAAGLIALRFAPPDRPQYRRLAWVGFLITAIAIAIVIVRRLH